MSPAGCVPGGLSFDGLSPGATSNSYSDADVATLTSGAGASGFGGALSKPWRVKLGARNNAFQAPRVECVASWFRRRPLSHPRA